MIIVNNCLTPVVTGGAQSEGYGKNNQCQAMKGPATQEIKYYVKGMLGLSYYLPVVNE